MPFPNPFDTPTNGKPRKYETPQEMAQEAARYFQNPPVRTKYNREGEAVEVPYITISGLARHLGFESRQSMYDYEKRDGFSYIIKNCKLAIEEMYEFNLLEGVSTTGAIFALKNMGWSDKSQQEISGPNGEPVWKIGIYNADNGDK